MAEVFSAKVFEMEYHQHKGMIPLHHLLYSDLKENTPKSFKLLPLITFPYTNLVLIKVSAIVVLRPI